LIDVDVNIRPFLKGDLEEIVAIASELGLSRWTATDYLDEMTREDSTMLVADGVNGLVGFIVGRRVPATCPDGGHDAEIYNIGVSRSLQRSGLGTRLLGAFIHCCRHWDAGEIWLEVRSANVSAISFYEKFGFEEYAVRKAFYRDPIDDGVLMRLRLDPRES
jgi:[ribosomal protein S18]-alanine N-acetyltransferase